MLKPPNPLHLLLGNRVPTLLTTSRLEPNHFEQSFGGAPETPGGTKLPSVTASTSPSSLLLGPRGEDPHRRPLDIDNLENAYQMLWQGPD